MKSKRARKPSKARRVPFGGLPPTGLPKSVIDEVRAIRNDLEEIIPDRGVGLSYSCTEHSTECSICGELGNHACLPILHEAIESSEEFAGECWKAFKTLEKVGYFQIEEGVGKTIPLEDQV